MKKYKLRKPVVYSMYALGFGLLVTGLVYTESSLTKKDAKDPDYQYIKDEVTNDDIPVISTTNVIAKPYNNDGVKILKEYYDYRSDESKQENSIIYYESTYMQSNTVIYGGVDSFDVLAILDGTISSIKEDDISGKIIEIQHDNGIVSVYQSVDEISVKENQIVQQGEVIAKSGKCNLNKDLKNHLSFELLVNSQIVNPEEFYNKDIKDISKNN